MFLGKFVNAFRPTVGAKKDTPVILYVSKEQDICWLGCHGKLLVTWQLELQIENTTR